jgi:DHA2 family multidrug resistance protein
MPNDQLFWPNMVRAIGQALAMTPLSAAAIAGIEPKNASSASAWFNMMRNLGGAIGITALQTLLTRRAQYHSDVLMQSVSVFEAAPRLCRDRPHRAETGLHPGLSGYLLRAQLRAAHRPPRLSSS